jgi:hypothetical protein
MLLFYNNSNTKFHPIVCTCNYIYIYILDREQFELMFMAGNLEGHLKNYKFGDH